MDSTNECELRPHVERLMLRVPKDRWPMLEHDMEFDCQAPALWELARLGIRNDPEAAAAPPELRANHPVPFSEGYADVVDEAIEAFESVE